MIVLFGYLE